MRKRNSLTHNLPRENTMQDYTKITHLKTSPARTSDLDQDVHDQLGQVFTRKLSFSLSSASKSSHIYTKTRYQTLDIWQYNKTLLC